MAPVPKAKAAGVSASSFLDLKAELAKKEGEFALKKAAGKSTDGLIGGVKRPDKKPTVWGKPNKGVNNRATLDFELEEVSRPTLDAARAVLERKAKIYEKLSKGKSGGLNDKQYDALLVDFDSKPTGPWEDDSDDIDESLSVPKPPQDENDPIVEYEDEFGRLRTAPRSEVPRHLLEPEKNEEDDFDPYLIYNPVNHFPTYQPTEERLAEIREQFAEDNNPLNVHYDANAEVRAKGAGFYQFSGDEETRKKQMEELRRAREETEKTRQEVGAVDLRPGEAEGLADGKDIVVKKSRALEKRKREIEERRRLIEAKRRKKDPSALASIVTPPPSEPPRQLPPSPERPEHPPADAMDELAQTPSDPFAALEAEAARFDRKGKGKQTAKPLDAADAFLANLEQEIVSGKKR